MSLNIACSWSGGKDSCFALMREVAKGHRLKAILNIMNESGKISRSHGLPASVLGQQAISMKVPLITRASSWSDYQKNFIDTLKVIANEFEVQAMVFGDIDLQQHRDWEEMVCAESGLTALLPLWKEERKKLVIEMLDGGIEAIIVSCNTTMGEEFLGRKLSVELLPELETLGIDVCGENGEFHTVVVNCPLFEKEIILPSADKILHENYWFLYWSDS